MTRSFQMPGRSPVIAENGMAATSHPLATAAAVDILRTGGNAVDAAIAASAVLCVVEPHMTGIGGDCFVILSEPDGTVHGLNGSGRAPARLTADMLRGMGHETMPESGVHSVTVPGALKAWEVLLQRFGTRDLGRLFADAIRYAEDGFAVHSRVAWDWARHAAALAGDEGGRRHYLTAGRAPSAGSRFRNPGLAQTFRVIARKGAGAFYEGAIAAEIAWTVRAQGGFLDEEDLAGVTADWVAPIATRYRGLDVLEIPPNGQGITALILLNLFEALGADGFDANGADRWHMEIEAARLAYGVLARDVGDPDAMSAEVSRILSGPFTTELAARFDPARRNPDLVLPDLPKSDTVYLSVVDRDRRAVSFINSTYDAFGSKVVTPVSGIALQNRGACFTLERGHPNEFGPGKRPLHTIIPGMAMKDGLPYAPFGVMGGAYQPMGHAHVLSNILDHGMDPQEAIDHPRLFWDEDEDGVLLAEEGLTADVAAELQAFGHIVRPAPRPHGGAQMIVIDRENGFLVGASDSRKDGCAGGW